MQGEALVLIPSRSAQAAGRILISSFFEKGTKCSLTGCHVYEKWLCISAKRPGDVTRAIRSPADELQRKENVRREVLHLPLSPRLASPRSALVQKHTICPIFWLGALLFFSLFFLQPEEVCLCVQAANKGSTMSSICRPSTPTGTLFVSGTLNNNNSNNSRTSFGGVNTLQCVSQFLTT